MKKGGFMVRGRCLVSLNKKTKKRTSKLVYKKTNNKGEATKL